MDSHPAKSREPRPHDHDLDEPIKIVEIKQPNPGAAFAAQKRAELEMIRRIGGGHAVAKESWKESGFRPKKRKSTSQLQSIRNSHVHFRCNFDNSFVNDHGITVSDDDIPF